MLRVAIPFVIGWLLYGMALLVPITSSLSLWAIYTQSDIPFKASILFIDFNTPAFMLSAFPAVGLLFYSYAYLKLPPIQSAIVHFLTTMSLITALPDMIFPIGDGFYENLDYLFGIVSLMLAFSTIILLLAFLFTRRTIPNTLK